jgi:hypothetical protein
VARQLHFLQASTGSANTGAKVGSYTVHYANGRREEISLIYNENLAEFIGPVVDLSQAESAWQGPDDPRSSDNRGRLFKFTWSNPSPEQEIASIDFTSTFTEAVPFLVGLTVE